MNNTIESMYAALEGAGVWLQVDRSGVGHNWIDLADEELRYDVIDALWAESDGLVAGTEINFGGVPYRLRNCEFSD